MLFPCCRPGEDMPSTSKPDSPCSPLGCISFSLPHLQWCCHSNRCHQRRQERATSSAPSSKLDLTLGKVNYPDSPRFPHPTGLLKEVWQLVRAARTGTEEHPGTPGPRGPCVSVMRLGCCTNENPVATHHNTASSTWFR